MSERTRTPTPEGLARQTGGANDPLEIRKADGRLLRVNVPRPGMVTVAYPGGRVEELTTEAFAERERAAKGVP